MVPPEGAWMTRDGDIIEIGCHTGSKTWSLRCDSNDWVGSVGLCGKALLACELHVANTLSYYKYTYERMYMHKRSNEIHVRWIA